MTIDIYKNEAELVKKLTEYFKNKKINSNKAIKDEILNSFFIKEKKAFKKTIKI